MTWLQTTISVVTLVAAIGLPLSSVPADAEPWQKYLFWSAIAALVLLGILNIPLAVHNNRAAAALKDNNTKLLSQVSQLTSDSNSLLNDNANLTSQVEQLTTGSKDLLTLVTRLSQTPQKLDIDHLDADAGTKFEIITISVPYNKDAIVVFECHDAKLNIEADAYHGPFLVWEVVANGKQAIRLSNSIPTFHKLSASYQILGGVSVPLKVELLQDYEPPSMNYYVTYLPTGEESGFEEVIPGDYYEYSQNRNAR